MRSGTTGAALGPILLSDRLLLLHHGGPLLFAAGCTDNSADALAQGMPRQGCAAERPGRRLVRSCCPTGCCCCTTAGRCCSPQGVLTILPTHWLKACRVKDAQRNDRGGAWSDLVVRPAVVVAPRRAVVVRRRVY